MKTMKSKLASLGLALVMAMTMILSNVSIANVQAADTVTVNGEAKEVVERISLTAGFTTGNLVQFTNVYDFGVKDNARLGFSGTLKLDGEVQLESENQFYFSGYNNNTTICLNFASDHQGKVLTIEKDSVIYSGDKAVVISETFNKKSTGSGWEDILPEPKTLNLEYRYGTSTLIQVNTDLPKDIDCADFLTDAEGCYIKQDGHTIGWIGMSKPDGEDTVVLTFNFNTAFAKDQSFTLGKDSVFKFTGSDDLYILDKDYTFTFNGTDFATPAPEPTVPKTLNLAYRYGTSTLIQVNTDLPKDIDCADFLTNAEGCDIKQNGHTIGWIGMSKPDGEDTVVLTFNFNTAFAKDQSFTLGKDSVFKFAGSDDLYVLDKDYTFTFNGTDFADPIPEPEKPEHTHTYVKTVVKATTTKAGSITEKCECGSVKSKTTINPASKISLSKTTLTYNKKTQKVTLSVKDSKGKALSTSQYSVSGKLSAKAVGTMEVKVSLKGNYSGTKILTWKINPKSTKVTSVKAAKKSLTVKWAKQTAETKGYKIQVSTDKNFKKNVKTVTINSNKTTSKKITGLKKNKKYYVRICTIKGSNASTWTKYSKSVKVK